MTRTIVNLTLPLITNVIEEVLQTYPHHPYQKAFANYDTKESLIAYVMTRVSSCYVSVEEQEKQQIMNSNPLQHCQGELTDIEPVIHQGIGKIMSEYFKPLSEEVAEVTEVKEEISDSLSPSHWFG
jgi:hypothetical protein